MASHALSVLPVDKSPGRKVKHLLFSKIKSFHFSYANGYARCTWIFFCLAPSEGAIHQGRLNIPTIVEIPF